MKCENFLQDLKGAIRPPPPDLPVVLVRCELIGCSQTAFSALPEGRAEQSAASARFHIVLI